MSLLGRLVHYSIDAVLISTVFAGVRRTTGFAPNTDALPESARPFAETFLRTGDKVYSSIQGAVVNSQYFKKT
ncbi:DUF1748-domain-containing protein [Fistulina hepatica ATCC 64428]|uniref:DUF1748-domain-containing protein n=1 Tax=Fistulina hepatica ATCC 64428 TaxID=1128425 RepID=A0A0D7AKC9_9AGAR|nr:DUF1748-domain-containing protein [Fistulina hepatica ATCC 64428]